MVAVKVKVYLAWLGYSTKDYRREAGIEIGRRMRVHIAEEFKRSPAIVPHLLPSVLLTDRTHLEFALDIIEGTGVENVNVALPFLTASTTHLSESTVQVERVIMEAMRSSKQAILIATSAANIGHYIKLGPKGASRHLEIGQFPGGTSHVLALDAKFYYEADQPENIRVDFGRYANDCRTFDKAERGHYQSIDFQAA